LGQIAEKKSQSVRRSMQAYESVDITQALFQAILLHVAIATQSLQRVSHSAVSMVRHGQPGDQRPTKQLGWVNGAEAEER
jgi:hypothetical protein